MVLLDIDYFINDKFRVLCCMAERQIEVSGLIFTPISQRQIADITGISFGRVNTIIKYLKNNGYISYNGTSTRGKYSLTDKAQLTIREIDKAIKNINEYVSNNNLKQY